MDDRPVGDGTTTLSDPPPRSLLAYGPHASRHSFGDVGGVQIRLYDAGAGRVLSPITSRPWTPPPTIALPGATSPSSRSRWGGSNCRLPRPARPEARGVAGG